MEQFYKNQYFASIDSGIQTCEAVSSKALPTELSGHLDEIDIPTQTFFHRAISFHDSVMV